MKTHLRELLTDLKAAARIGHPETIESALEGLRALTAEELPPASLLPFGLAFAQVGKKMLQTMLSDPDPAIRGVAAVALAHQYLSGGNVTSKDLTSPAKDRSPEVRAALLQALTQTQEGTPSPEQLEKLAETWLGAGSKILVQAGLTILPTCGFSATRLREILLPMQTEPDYGVRAALVETLNALASNHQAGTILSILEEWSGAEDPNVWVITRTLSGSWSQDNSPKAQKILQQVEARVGRIRAISRAIARHS